jgi:hypothetical protein
MQEYRAAISHEFIRSRLGFSNVVRLKKNGTFKRTVALLDESGNLYEREFRVQTALWVDADTGDAHYVSIFPNFIRRYTRPCLNVLEYISCHTEKGEDIFRHIDDSNAIYSCEDRFARILTRIDNSFAKEQYASRLKAQNAAAFSRPVSNPSEEARNKRFPFIISLILMAREYFSKPCGVLACIYSIFLF